MDTEAIERIEPLDLLEAAEVDNRAATTHQSPFSKHHVYLHEWTADLTTAMQRVLPIRSKDYTTVRALLLRWEDDNLGTHSEIQELDKVFREIYNYETECATIPSRDAQNELQYAISKFNRENDSETGLLILYYGGHGVKGPNNQSIWAATDKKTSPMVNWTRIESTLIEDAKADVLFILDCCFASRAGTRAPIQGSKEVLAACSMEDGTTGVADNSFTRNIIEELKFGVRANLTTWKLNNKMMKRRADGLLEFTPRHFPLSDGGNPCICLRPLARDSNPSLEIHVDKSGKSFENGPPTPGLTDSTSLSSLGSEDRILLSICLKDWAAPPLKEQWLKWIKEQLPDNIKAITASYQPSEEPDSPNQPHDRLGYTVDTLQGLTGFQESDRAGRIAKELVVTENAFESDSMLLLVSIPLPLWDFLPENPAYSCIGYIRSSDPLTPLKRTRSMSQEIRNGMNNVNRQHWWFKWYVVGVWVVIPLICWPDLMDKSVKRLFSFLVLMIFAVATPFGLLSIADNPGSIPASANLTQTFRQRHYEG